jgi:hypothetical protein
MTLYKSAKYGVMVCLGVGFVAAFFDSHGSLPRNHEREAGAGLPWLLLFGFWLLCLLVVLVYVREYAKEFKWSFDRSGMERPLRYLLGLLGIRITDELPVCSAAFVTLVAIAILLPCVILIASKWAFPSH